MTQATGPRNATGRGAFGVGQGHPLRIPSALLVISPFTATGTVWHQVLSHLSLLNFIEDLFHLQPLTFRDRGANGLAAFFDFSKPARSPLILAS
jgi:hypothetical protein